MEIWGPKLSTLSFKDYVFCFSQKAVRLETILTPSKGSLLNKGTADTALILIQAMWHFFFLIAVFVAQNFEFSSGFILCLCMFGVGDFLWIFSLISFTLSSAIKIIFNVRNSLLLVIRVPLQYLVKYTTGSRYSQICMS